MLYCECIQDSDIIRSQVTLCIFPLYCLHVLLYTFIACYHSSLSALPILIPAWPLGEDERYLYLSVCLSSLCPSLCQSRQLFIFFFLSPRLCYCSGLGFFILLLTLIFLLFSLVFSPFTLSSCLSFSLCQTVPPEVNPCGFK